MDQNFECFVEINGFQYDIVIKEDVSSVCFQDIYQKIQQISKLALNEDIAIGSHVFEIFDQNSTKGTVVQTFNHFVKHKSLIRIQNNESISPSISASIESLLNEYNQYLAANPESTVEEPPNIEQNFIPHEYYCDVCPQSAQPSNIDPRLKKLKLNLNFESYKRFTDLLSTVKEMCDSRVYKISEYDWLNVVPIKMRAFGYENFSPKLWKNTFDLFLDKYIQVMNESPNQSIACSLFPFLHEFNGFQFDSTKDRKMNRRISDLRYKMKRKERDLSEDRLTERERSERKAFKRLIEKILDNEMYIKVFHFMVQLIDPNATSKKERRKMWPKISEILIKNGYERKKFSENKCVNEFYYWSHFYAENYDKLEGRLDSEVQKIFDWFKIVHILDTDKMWSSKHKTPSLIKKIGHRSEIKQYLNDLNNRQLQLKPVHSQRRDRSRSDSSETRKSSRDIEEREIVDKEDRDPKSSKSSESVAENTSCKTSVSLSDPRLSRLNSKPTSVQMNTSNDCLESVPMDLEDSEEIAVNSVINVNRRPSAVRSDLCAKWKNSFVSTSVLNDPRLRVRASPQSNGREVRPLQTTEKRVVKTVDNNSNSSPKESPTPRPTLPSKPSVCISDPRLRKRGNSPLIKANNLGNSPSIATTTEPIVKTNEMKTKSVNTSKQNEMLWHKDNVYYNSFLPVLKATLRTNSIDKTSKTRKEVPIVDKLRANNSEKTQTLDPRLKRFNGTGEHSGNPSTPDRNGCSAPTQKSMDSLSIRELQLRKETLNRLLVVSKEPSNISRDPRLKRNQIEEVISSSEEESCPPNVNKKFKLQPIDCL